MELMGGTMSNFLEYARSRLFTGDFDSLIITSLSVKVGLITGLLLNLAKTILE
jgi:hypothetical protein